MPVLDLTYEEARALIRLVRQTLEYARYRDGAAPRPAESDPRQTRAAHTGSPLPAGAGLGRGRYRRR